MAEDAERVEAEGASVGEAKRAASRAVKHWLPGSVWAAGGEFVMCETRGHLENAVGYVLYDQGPGAWTWSFRDRSASICRSVSRKRRRYSWTRVSGPK